MITQDKKAYYLDIAKNWNTEDKETIAKRWGTSVFGVAVIARNIERKTGMKMRRQKKTVDGMYTQDFIEELKTAYR